MSYIYIYILINITYIYIYVFLDFSLSQLGSRMVCDSWNTSPSRTYCTPSKRCQVVIQLKVEKELVLAFLVGRWTGLGWIRHRFKAGN